MLKNVKSQSDFEQTDNQNLFWPPVNTKKERFAKPWLVWTTLALLLMSGCTSIGRHNKAAYDKIDFGAQEDLRICIYTEDQVSEERIEEIVTALRDEFQNYQINVKIPWIRSTESHAFFGQDILEHAVALPLESPCDRVLLLTNRDLGDFMWGMLLPEMVGAVDTVTRTRGYVAAEYGSLNQLLFASPSDTAVHEVYHMLGCDHGACMDSCYEKIHSIKKAAMKNRLRGKNFFPGINSNGFPLRSREMANTDLKMVFGDFASSHPSKNRTATAHQIP
jgi:hypothetical protein